MLNNTTAERGSLTNKNSFSAFINMIGIFLMLGYACYYPYVEKIFSGAKLRIIFLLAILLFACGLLKTGGKIQLSTSLLKDYVFWLLLAIMFSLHNQFLKLNGSINAATLRFVAAIVMAFAISNSIGWFESVWKLLIGLLMPYCLATYFFMLFPSTYINIGKFYGYYPAGTNGGTVGYRAGLADHYSQNGIYLSILFMMFGAMWIAQVNGNIQKEKKKSLIILLCMVLGSLILTGKRAVLIVSVCALLLTYLFSVRQNFLKKWGRFIVIVGLGIFALYIVVLVNPVFAYVFERMQGVGSDGASLERLAMWNLAISLFLKHPIFGIGFYGYRYKYAENLFVIFHPKVLEDERYLYQNAHNVYIQLLCENGIIGFLIYAVAVIAVAYITIQLVRTKERELRAKNQHYYVIFSLAMQMYYLAYSITGNCLYDIVFIFYMVAVAYIFSIRYALRKEGRSVVGDEVSSNINLS